MLEVKVLTPTFLVEQDIDRLKGKLPVETVERLGRSLQQFRAWVAVPALMKPDAEVALQHIVQDASIVAVQFKTEFLQALDETEGARELFFSAVTTGLEISEAHANENLATTADLLVSGARTWLRFFAAHPDVKVDQLGGMERVMEAINLSFHADNVLTVCMMGFNGECGEVEPALLAGLSSHARELAAAYYSSIREMVEAFAPPLDETDPFKATTLQDLLNLPPYDGETMSIDEMDEAIEAQFESA